MEIFGERLKKLREEKGLNLKEAGKIFGITGEAFSAYEKGKREPKDLEMFKRICEYFNIRPSYLLGMSDNKNSDSKKIEITIDKNNNISLADLKNMLNTIVKKIDEIKK